MLIALCKPGYNNRARVPGYGYVEFGKNDQWLLEVEDVDGETLIQYNRNMFMRVSPTPIKGVRTADAAPLVAVVPPVAESEPVKPVHYGRGHRKEL